jgi:glycerol-3-phosphate dehydrogenase (NAD(P)+)
MDAAAKIAVLGAGAWGTALAIQAARAGNAVSLWTRDPARALALASRRENAAYLPGQALPEAITVTADAGAALADAAFALLAIPLQHLRATLPATRLPLVACAKGVETGTLRLPLEVLAEARPDAELALLSGPNFAHEIAAGLPAATLVASRNAALRGLVAARLGSAGFRLYGSDDTLGAQVGGAAKNVIAIAAGAVTGAGLGENARAALITRGLAELARLTLALGGKAETAAGLSGLGDLLLTATGPGSRNTALGMDLGQGLDLQAALARRTGVVEGVATAPAIVARAASAGVELPICAAVADLLANRQTLAQSIARLMARPPRDE